MAKISKADLAQLRMTVQTTGELRVHLITARSNMSCKARLWHTDGQVLATASGYGYDKRGTVLGDVIELMFTQEQLKACPAAYVRAEDGYTSKVQGFRDLADGRRVVDGGCGYECMLNMLRALGYDATMYSTGKWSDMVLARKVQA